jgi:hypothetical protein
MQTTSSPQTFGTMALLCIEPVPERNAWLPVGTSLNIIRVRVNDRADLNSAHTGEDPCL